MPWFVYILRCGDGSLYTGITTDPAKRLAAHLRGRGSKYTRGRRPLALVYLKSRASRSAALRREAAIKSLSRAQKLRLIAADSAEREGAARSRQRPVRRTRRRSRLRRPAHDRGHCDPPPG